MARLLGYLLLLALLGYGLWPYYTVFRLDDAVREPNTDVLAPFVDLPAIQTAYRGRLQAAVPAFEPRPGPGADQVVQWLRINISRLGDAALDQGITLDWVRNMLREAAEERVRNKVNTVGWTSAAPSTRARTDAGGRRSACPPYPGNVPLVSASFLWVAG
jgi:hypothetical protein